jgi:WD40 repeat protein
LSGRRLTKIVDAATGRVTTQLLLENGVFSRNGKRILGLDRTGGRGCCVVDAETGEPVARVGDRALDYPVAFSPDDHYVLTRGAEGARVWNATTGEPATPPLERGVVVDSAAFTPDGKFVVTVTGSSRRVWDVRSGKPATPRLPQVDEWFMDDNAMNRKYSCIVRAGADLSARKWTPATGTLFDERAERLGSLLSMQRIDQAGTLQRLSKQEAITLWDDLREQMPGSFRPPEGTTRPSGKIP